MYKKRQPKLATPTHKQVELSAEIQKRWIDPSQYDDCTMAVHISQALAQVIDGMSKNVKPPQVLEALAVLKLAYLTLFGDQHMTALAQLLGDRETLEKVMNHENAKSIVNRILTRMGDISPGMPIPPIEVQDILKEEGFFA